jgi:8-oxo-dGTP pyrophosphatase MutT (NUDIX family)
MGMSSYYRQLRACVGTELLLMPAVAALVRDDGGRLLIQRTRSGDWSLPAGAIEPGESPAQAVVREVLEETGLVVRAQRVVGVTGGASSRVTYQNGDRVEYVVTVFECVRVSGDLSCDNDETEALAWFSLDELPQLAFPYPAAVLEPAIPEAYFEWDETWLKSAP